MKMCWFGSDVMKRVVAFVLAVAIVSILYFTVRHLWYLESERLFNSTCDPNFFAALGATSALFTGLAVVASAFAVGLQALAQKEARRKADSQLKTLMRQSFESSFFNIIGMHVEYDKSCNGIFFVKKYILFIKGNEKRIVDFYNAATEHVECDKAGKFINLCRIVLKYVDGANFLDEREKQFYVDVFKNNISDDECTLLAMHLVGKNGDPVIKSLAERFALFSLHRLQAVPEEVKAMYSPMIFGSAS